MKFLTDGTVTDVQGILACGMSCGIRKDGRKDLCVVYSRSAARVSAVFTTNKVKGAPILVNMENLAESEGLDKLDKTENAKCGYVRAIVVNSGNANACTGREGLADAYRMRDTAAQCLGVSPREVLIQSTGAMGVQLPMDQLLPGIEKACTLLSDRGGKDAAEAILTTDRSAKTLALEFELKGKKIRMAGMAKGSTMIHPQMATMLSVVVTDAGIEKQMLEKAFKASVDNSYNMISVDGDTSTNDMAVILANGEAGNDIIAYENEDFRVFCEALDRVNTELAKMIARGGEGSTKLLEVRVIHAKSIRDAKKAAKAIASSTLVKCALFGSHPAYPDIACAMGYSGADIVPDRFDIFIRGGGQELRLLKDAVKAEFDPAVAKSILAGDPVEVVVDLNTGGDSATAWGCDMSLEYVKANAYIQG